MTGDQGNKSQYSAVIATLGGQRLPLTVACLQASYWAPSEILICIPESDQHRAASVSDLPRVRIVPTHVRGQVAQRAVGFAEASSEFVLQCDDDVTFDPDVPGILKEALLALGSRNVVGPIFFDPTSRLPIARYATGVTGVLGDLYFSILGRLPWGKRRMGRFASTTCAISIDPDFVTGPVVGSQWLAGGFVLGWRDELISRDFYPMRGKAYSEDLLHSQERALHGINHHVVLTARVFTEPSQLTPTFVELKREFLGRYRVGRYLGGSSVSIAAFLSIEFLRRLLRIRARTCASVPGVVQ
jgi:hypothetical protein